MKQTLIIFLLLVAFNFGAPNSNLLVMKHRHIIEYAQENHTKSMTKPEIIRHKAVLYLKLVIIMSAAERLDIKDGMDLDTS